MGFEVGAAALRQCRLTAAVMMTSHSQHLIVGGFCIGIPPPCSVRNVVRFERWRSPTHLPRSHRFGRVRWNFTLWVNPRLLLPCALHPAANSSQNDFAASNSAPSFAPHFGSALALPPP